MISVTDLHGKELHLNADLIEQVGSNPDTQIVLTNGHRVYVAESPEEVAKRVIAYRRQCLTPCDSTTPDAVRDSPNRL